MTHARESTKVVLVEVLGSAYRHQIDDADMVHAILNPIMIHELDGFRMVCGPALDGTLLEVAVNDRDEVFHAMECRVKFLPKKR